MAETQSFSVTPRFPIVAGDLRLRKGGLWSSGQADSKNYLRRVKSFRAQCVSLFYNVLKEP